MNDTATATATNSLCTDDTFTFTGSSDPDRRYILHISTDLVDSIQMFFCYFESVSWDNFKVSFCTMNRMIYHQGRA